VYPSLQWPSPQSYLAHARADSSPVSEVSVADADLAVDLPPLVASLQKELDGIGATLAGLVY
jgi:hypothetical protein